MLKYHQEQKSKEVKAEKEESVRLRKIATSIAKEIKQFWSSVEKVKIVNGIILIKIKVSSNNHHLEHKVMFLSCLKKNVHHLIFHLDLLVVFHCKSQSSFIIPT